MVKYNIFSKKFTGAGAIALLCTISVPVDSACSITGATCEVNSQVTGICVPLDSKGESQDCYNVYGFFAGPNDLCEQYWGSNYANV